MPSNLSRSLLAVFAAATLAACADSGRVIAPTALVDNAAVALEEIPQIVTLCKIGPAGTSATFNVTATGGELQYGSTVTLAATELSDPDKCIAVWRSAWPKPDPDVIHTVTVTEVSSTGNTVIDRIVSFDLFNGWIEYPMPGNSATVQVNYANGGLMLFKNVEGPDIGAEGCTPGYWKQKQHFDSYPAGVLPSTRFSTIFGSTAFGNKTLVQVMSTGGGGIYALGRHATAAYLNAATGVDYGMTTAEVIAAFNAAVLSGDYENTKNVLAGLNERGCPLN